MCDMVPTRREGKLFGIERKPIDPTLFSQPQPTCGHDAAQYEINPYFFPGAALQAGDATRQNTRKQERTISGMPDGDGRSGWAQ